MSTRPYRVPSYTPIKTNGGEVVPRSEFDALVDDLARVDEGVLSFDELSERWSICRVFDLPDIERNRILQTLVRLRRQERATSGRTPLELARNACAQDAVPSLTNIVRDKMVSARDKVSAVRELRAFAQLGYDDVHRAASEMFTLEIHIGDDVTVVSKGDEASEQRATPGPHNLRSLDEGWEFSHAGDEAAKWVSGREVMALQESSDEGYVALAPNGQIPAKGSESHVLDAAAGLCED